jgi:hypothetical protein
MSLKVVFEYFDLLDPKDQARSSSDHAISNQASETSCFFIRFAR